MTSNPAATDLLQRRQTLYAARDRGDSEYLIAALLDPDHRKLAAKFLGDLQVVAATRPLLRLLDATDPHVRVVAIDALGRLGVEEARAPLRELARNDDEAMVRAWAIDALGKFGEAEDVEFLIGALKDSSARVRGAAALALGRAGDERAIEPLRAARRRLRRSPADWYLHRRVYNDAIGVLSRSRQNRHRFPQAGS